MADVRYWHKADIGLRGLNVCFGGKVGVGAGSHWRMLSRVRTSPGGLKNAPASTRAMDGTF
jgi:hypothetical protein